MNPYLKTKNNKKQNESPSLPIKPKLDIPNTTPKAKALNSGENYIDFETIQTFINIKDPILFATYLKEIFKDLAERTDTKTKKGITKLTFYDYIKLPILIADKLFLTGDQDNDGYLNGMEFIEGGQNGYGGDFDSTLEMIFKLFDFDKDGQICREDVKILLSYLPLKSDKITVHYQFQMESGDEIEDILNKTFDDKQGMKFPEFKNAVETKKSDVYLQVLCFLYQKKPFNNQSVNSGIGSKKKILSWVTPQKKKQSSPNLIDSLRFETYKNVNQNSNGMVVSPTIKGLSPSTRTTFSPAQDVIKIAKFNEKNIPNFTLASPDKDSENVEMPQFNSDISIKTNNTNKLPSNTPILSGIKGMIRMNNEKRSNERTSFNNNQTRDIQDIIKNSKEGFSSPTAFLLNSSEMSDDEGSSNINVQNNLPEFERINLNISSDSDNSDGDEVKEEKTITYENWVYKVTKSGKLKQFYLVLINKDLFYYKTDAKDEVSGMHTGSGCFIKECDQVTIQNTKGFMFQISSSKVRNYYTTHKKVAKEFVENIKKGIGYLNFFDYYEMGDDIGEGKFGLVKGGVHKQTKERVAIKIIKKNDMKIADIELVRSEIDIMKLCHHVNIVHGLDHFENSDYIFIVMEYISSGDGDTFLHQQEELLSEERAADGGYQIASGIQYGHKYGIVHRDGKPENVMLSITKNKKNKTEKIRVKIMDFGGSKIMGPNEKVDDGFGTLSFVAPEVLLRIPYNKAIDIWSIAVIGYYMLSGQLPFDDPNENEEIIANKTVYTDVDFSGGIWKERSNEVIDGIKKCLTKEAGDRLKIEEVLGHSWMIKYNGNRKESLDICTALININESKKANMGK